MSTEAKRAVRRLIEDITNRIAFRDSWAAVPGWRKEWIRSEWEKIIDGAYNPQVGAAIDETSCTDDEPLSPELVERLVRAAMEAHGSAKPAVPDDLLAVAIHELTEERRLHLEARERADKAEAEVASNRCIMDTLNHSRETLATRIIAAEERLTNIGTTHTLNSTVQEMYETHMHAERLSVERARVLGEALRRIELHGWTNEYSPTRGGFSRCRCGAATFDGGEVQHVNPDCPTGIAREALALLSSLPAPCATLATAWRREAPTVEEAHECPRWWFRGWLNCFKPMPANDRTDGVLLVLDPDPLGEGIECQEVTEHVGEEGQNYTVNNCKGEWAPCLFPTAAPLPAGVVVEAARKDGDE